MNNKVSAKISRGFYWHRWKSVKLSTTAELCLVNFELRQLYFYETNFKAILLIKYLNISSILFAMTCLHHFIVLGRTNPERKQSVMNVSMKKMYKGSSVFYLNIF